MGAKETRAQVFTGLSRDQALSLAVAENVQRSDLTPLEKALLCKRLQDEGKSRRQKREYILHVDCRDCYMG